MNKKESEIKHSNSSVEKISTTRQVFYVFTLIFGLYTIPLAYCLARYNRWSYNNFKTDEEREHMIKLSDVLVMIGCGTAMIITRELMVKLLYPFFHYYCKEQDIEAIRQKRAIKACECTFKFLYFTGTTIYGYYVLKDIDWFAWYLGGNGDMINGYTDMP